MLDRLHNYIFNHHGSLWDLWVIVLLTTLLERHTNYGVLALLLVAGACVSETQFKRYRQ